MSARCSRPTTRTCGGARALRRDGREVHRRRRHGALRRAVAHEDDPERAVRAALAIRDWARDAGRAAGADRASTPAKRSSPSTRERARASRWQPATSSTPRPACRRPRRSTASSSASRRIGRPARRSSTRRSSLWPRKGKAEPIPRLGGGAGRCRASASTSTAAASTPLVGRARELELLVVDARPRARGAVAAAGHAGRRARDRQVPARRRAVPGGRARPSRSSRGARAARCPTATASPSGRWPRSSRRRRASSRPTRREARGEARRAVGAGRRRRERRRSGSSATCGRSSASSEASRPAPDEGFAAWRRFLEALAEQQPLVLVFEDLHWADDALLDFVDALVEATRRAAARARDRTPRAVRSAGPGWGGGKPNALAISLSPLSDEETAGSCTRCSTVAARRADAGGTARARRRQPALRGAVRALCSTAGTARGLPETVQGIIAARLDALPTMRSGCSRTPRSSERCSGSAPSRRSTASRAGRPKSCCTRSSARSSSSALVVRPSGARRSTRSATS